MEHHWEILRAQSPDLSLRAISMSATTYSNCPHYQRVVTSMPDIHGIRHASAYVTCYFNQITILIDSIRFCRSGCERDWIGIAWIVSKNTLQTRHQKYSRFGRCSSCQCLWTRSCQASINGWWGLLAKKLLLSFRMSPKLTPWVLSLPSVALHWHYHISIVLNFYCCPLDPLVSFVSRCCPRQFQSQTCLKCL